MTMLNPEESGLIVVDVQDSFLQLIPNPDSLVNRLATFLQVPKRLDVPVLMTEQTPDKLGSAAEKIRQAVPESRIASKNTFDCFGSEQFEEWLQEEEVQQLVLVGIMTNICILQTALEGLDRDQLEEVHVMADGTAAESHEDHGWALNRIDQAGGTITTIRTVVYEWLRRPDRQEFDDLLPVLKELGEGRNDPGENQ